MNRFECLPAIDEQLLARVLARQRRTSAAEVAEWHANRIHSGGGEAEGVYRIYGTQSDGNAASDWSLILKTLKSSSPYDDVTRWNYQQREWRFYRSGLLKGQHGLVAPRCLGVMHRRDGSTWLWLEDVDEEDEAWPLARYGLSAYHLGRFSGQFISAGALPDYPWLSRRWLRGWLEEAAPAIAQLRLLRDDPAVQRVYDDADNILHLWEEREKRLSALEQCPQTLCHLDAHRRNMFSRRSAGEDKTVFIDWAFVGLAGLGEDLASLVSATIAMGEVALGDMKELEATVTDGYLEGLRDAGCRIDPELVHMAYSLAASLRLPVGAVRLVLPMLLDPGLHRDVEQQHHGTPIETLFDRWAAMNRQLILLGDGLAD